MSPLVRVQSFRKSALPARLNEEYDPPVSPSSLLAVVGGDGPEFSPSEDRESNAGQVFHVDEVVSDGTGLLVREQEVEILGASVVREGFDGEVGVGNPSDFLGDFREKRRFFATSWPLTGRDGRCILRIFRGGEGSPYRQIARGRVRFVRRIVAARICPLLIWQ